MGITEDNKDGSPSPTREPARSSIDTGSDDTTIIPKGALDPVYEAKARVLNKAVRLFQHPAGRVPH